MLTISMLTYRHLDYIARMAEALDRQSWTPPFELILVNNGGCRESATIARRRGWRVAEPGCNLSYAAGHNLAAKHARGEYLLQLNDDAIPEPGFLAALWQHRDAADVLGGLQLDPDGRVNHAGGFIDGTPWPRHAGRFEPRAAHEGRGVRPCEWVTGAVLLVRRDLFLGLGGLDEVYFYGCEDSDFCLRAVEAGYRIGVNLDAVSIHGELGTRAGGAADAPNEAIFRRRWLAKLPALAQRARANWES